jgi:hypothetical protein
MSTRLLRDMRVLVQHAETIAAAGRRIIRELEGAEIVGAPINDARVESAVRTVEQRAIAMCAEIGVQWQEQAERAAIARGAARSARASSKSRPSSSPRGGTGSTSAGGQATRAPGTGSTKAPG